MQFFFFKKKFDVNLCFDIFSEYSDQLTEILQIFLKIYGKTNITAAVEMKSRLGSEKKKKNQLKNQ